MSNDISSGLGYAPGQMGWVVPEAQNEQQMLDGEKRYYYNAVAENPAPFQSRPARDLPSPIRAAWDKFQLDKGRFAGSSDLSLIDEFVFKKSLTFLPQDIGSCVWSNTFRRIIERMCVEIALNGDPEEYPGLDEFGIRSIAPFCVSYGFARQRANMRRGDGLYCSPMQESLVKDGLVLCNTPKLKELMDRVGATSERDYPEVRSTSLYRQIGNWAWNDELRPYGDCKLEESPKVKTYEEFCANEDALKPMFVCSMIAIRVKGTHRDGFKYHTRNMGDSWAHNMGIGGRRVTSNGERFHRVDNTSWLQPNEGNRDAYVYWIEAEEVKSWFDRGIVDVGTVGEISGIPSLPVM
jgi:hypothetical protein